MIKSESIGIFLSNYCDKITYTLDGPAFWQNFQSSLAAYRSFSGSGVHKYKSPFTRNEIHCHSELLLVWVAVPEAQRPCEEPVGNSRGFMFWFFLSEISSLTGSAEG